MTLLRQHRIASFLQALVAIVAFSIAEVDFGMLFTGVVLAVLSWYVTEGPRGRTLPDWAANTLVVAAIGWEAFRFIATGELADAMGALGRAMAWILLAKLFARRTASEERQRFALSTMLVIAGCLQSVQFAFGVLIVVYACVSIWSAMLWRLARSADEARRSREASGAAPGDASSDAGARAGFAPPLEIVVGRRAVPQFRGLVAASILVVLSVGVAVFILFPRFADIGSVGGRGPGATTGFNEEIRLRRGDRITESRRELFSVRWIDPDGSPRRMLRPLLLRGAVLGWYDPSGERWVPQRAEAGIRTVRTPEDGAFASLARGTQEATGAVSTIEIEMRSYATVTIFSVYAPIAIATSEPRSVSVDPSTLVLRDVSRDRTGRYWNYSLRVQPQPSADMLSALASGSASRSGNLSFPIAEVRPVAESILAELPASASLPPRPDASSSEEERAVWGREVARAIAAYMRANFTYTTDLSRLPRVEGEDPILSFLTRYRSGHCEYFASGLCAVLRSLGIPSRIVTGFIAIEYDDNAAHYIVRESNAHAWVEVRTGRDAWMAVDATPEESLVEMQERNRSFMDGFRWIYGSLEFLWNSRVVSYDASVQSTYASRLQGGWRDAIGERLEAALARMRALALDLSLGRAGGAWFATIAVGLSTALLAVLIVALRRRRLRARLRLGGSTRAEQRRLLREAAFYIEALDLLARAGLAKPGHLTPQAWAARLAERDRAVGEAFGAIADTFYRVRYGGASGGRSGADSHHSLVVRLRAALRQNPRLARAD
jgi:transglutaminase-like putative cysteine protease